MRALKSRRQKYCLFPVLAIAGIVSVPAGASGQTIAQFYQGKTISLIVSSAPGGGYDATARLTGRHLGRHIPGNPVITVQNMPGAGGIRAANHIYNIAPKDGTVIALMQNTVPFDPLLGNKAAAFDATKINWLGSPNVEIALLMVWHSAGIKTPEDLRRKEITAGVAGIASNQAQLSRLLIKAADFKLKLVQGYPGANETLLAMERGEVDSFTIYYNSMMASRPTWHKEGKTVLLAQWGPHKEPAMADVPYLPDIVKEPEKATLLKAASASLYLGRPFVMGPGVPQDRVEAMRTALIETFKDPAFVEDSTKIGFTDLAPQTGAQLEQIVREVYAAPPAVIEQLKIIASGDGM